MGIHAIVFGGIGTLVETSELQRKAFNSAFADAGIAWRWDRDTYRRLLSIAGGQNRLRHFATASGDELSEEQLRSIHARKSELFLDALDRQSLPLRTGVQRLINKATNSDVRVAIASTTSRYNIVALARSARLDLDLFEVVLDRSSADKPKRAALIIDSRSANDDSFDRIADKFSPRISGLDLASCERLVAAIR